MTLSCYLCHFSLDSLIIVIISSSYCIFLCSSQLFLVTSRLRIRLMILQCVIYCHYGSIMAAAAAAAADVYGPLHTVATQYNACPVFFFLDVKSLPVFQFHGL